VIRILIVILSAEIVVLHLLHLLSLFQYLYLYLLLLPLLIATKCATEKKIPVDTTAEKVERVDLTAAFLTAVKVERADLTAAFLTAVKEERDQRADTTIVTKKNVKLFATVLESILEESSLEEIEINTVASVPLDIRGVHRFRNASVHLRQPVQL